MSRREFAARTLESGSASPLSPESAGAAGAISIIGAPTNLGLRPNEAGEAPGTWQAPTVLVQTGLAERLGASARMLDRPSYQFLPQFGTTVRNGLSIRQFSIQLGDAVAADLTRGVFPVVLGGDCSILLGCLLGARKAGGRGLVHVDGHSDFFHPGNYDPARRAGTAAGMDLALSTGRGELVLTRWSGDPSPLVADEDVVQVGERDAADGHYLAYPDVADTAIQRLLIQDVLTMGIPAAAAKVLDRLASRDLKKVWLHVDFDVLDQRTLPAVDSPGSPGFDVDQLARLLGALLGSGRFVGSDFAIYDPTLDPNHAHAQILADCVARAIEGRRTP